MRTLRLTDNEPSEQDVPATYRFPGGVREVLTGETPETGRLINSVERTLSRMERSLERLQREVDGVLGEVGPADDRGPYAA